MGEVSNHATINNAACTEVALVTDDAVVEAMLPVAQTLMVDVEALE